MTTEQPRPTKPLNESGGTGGLGGGADTESYGTFGTAAAAPAASLSSGREPPDLHRERSEHGLRMMAEPSEAEMSRGRALQAERQQSEPSGGSKKTN